MMKKIFILISVVFIAVKWTVAGTNPAAFLDIGVGARAIGMGGAFTAVSDDATSTYWNPAGLGNFTTFQTSFMMQRLSSAKWPGMEDIAPTYQFFNFIAPLDRLGISDKGSMAVSVILMGINNVPHTYLGGDGSIVRNSFDNSEAAYYLSVGYPIFFDELLVGGSIKYITQNFSGIDGGSATGWDADAGMLLKLSNRLGMGFLIRKGATLNWATGHTDRGALKSKIGLSYIFDISDRVNLLSACDFIQEKDIPLKSSLGMELSFDSETLIFNSASIRSGISGVTLENRYKNIGKLNESIQWNVGGGLKIDILNFNMQLDYTFSYYRLGSKHRVSLILKL